MGTMRAGSIVDIVELGTCGRGRAIVVEDGDYVAECSRHIHPNPNRSRITRPAERYRWSSYRNYVGGPAPVDWVETGRVMGLFGGDGTQYMAYVEAWARSPSSRLREQLPDWCWSGINLLGTYAVCSPVGKRASKCPL